MQKLLCVIIILAGSLFGQVQIIKPQAKIQYTIRKGTCADCAEFKALYQKVASIPGGLSRSPDEITDVYIGQRLANAQKTGFIFIAEWSGSIIGALITSKLEPKIFSHLLTDCTLFVDPDYQGQGIGTALIRSLQEDVKNNHPKIYCVHLMARESNPAINLYKRLGFVQEGVLKGTTRGVTGKLENDIFFGWFNPNFHIEAK